MSATEIWEWVGEIFSTPQKFGASSWVEVVYWFGGAVVALVATFNLRQDVKHARANFLLRIDDRWEALASERDAVKKEFDSCEAAMLKAHGRLKDQARQRKLEQICASHIEQLEQSNPSLFDKCLNYIGFLETVGVMLRGRSIPLRDIARLYKGPILDAAIMFRAQIQEWQKREPDGVYDNAVYLMRRIEWWEWRRLNFPFWRRLFGP